MVLTFDDYGVSGHRNHIDVCRGVRQVLRVVGLEGVQGLALISTGLVLKFTGPLENIFGHFATPTAACDSEAADVTIIHVSWLFVPLRRVPQQPSTVERIDIDVVS